MRILYKADTVVLGVIRGEIPLSALADIGIQVHFEEGSGKLTSEKIPVVVTPSVFDLASGLLAYRASPQEVKLWAFFLLAESGSVDMVKIESHPQGDLLINALWDASYEGKIPENAIKVSENLMKMQPQP